jgi:hypothetical protein
MRLTLGANPKWKYWNKFTYTFGKLGHFNSNGKIRQKFKAPGACIFKNSLWSLLPYRNKVECLPQPHFSNYY